MADVFISYKRERRAHAERLAVILEAYGYTVWWDYDLLVGLDFRDQIDNEISSCRAAVVLWCSASIKSNFVKSEAGRADSANKLLGAFLEEVIAPLGLDQAQAQSLVGWSGGPEDKALLKLVDAIELLVGKPRRSSTSLIDALGGLLPPLPRIDAIAEVADKSSDTKNHAQDEVRSPYIARVSPAQEDRFFEACRTADDYEAYLQAFPTGTYALLAQTRLTALDKEWISELGLSHADWSSRKSSEIVSALGPRASRPELEPRARRGCVEAQTLLAFRLSEAGDATGAVAQLRRAANGGFPRAQNTLAVKLRELGEGTLEESVELFKLAADQGNAIAQFNLSARCYNGEGTAKNNVEAYKWARRAAEHGYPPAQERLAIFLREGIGVSANSAESAKFMKMAADAGLDRAQLALAACLRDGRGTAKNLEQAAVYARKAADQGLPEAQYFLGKLFEDGLGVEKNFAAARGWYKRAADQGYQLAYVGLSALQKLI